MQKDHIGPPPISQASQGIYPPPPLNPTPKAEERVVKDYPSLITPILVLSARSISERVPGSKDQVASIGSKISANSGSNTCCDYQVGAALTSALYTEDPKQALGILEKSSADIGLRDGLIDPETLLQITAGRYRDKCERGGYDLLSLEEYQMILGDTPRTQKNGSPSSAALMSLPKSKVRRSGRSPEEANPGFEGAIRRREDAVK